MELGASLAERIRVTEAKANLSALMARAGYGGERFLIERHGRPLAALVGAGDLERLEGEREVDETPRRPRGALALVGAWGDVLEDEEIDAMLESIYSGRDRDLGRPVDLDA